MSKATIYPHKISIAPMMDYTDRHFRYVLRLITRRALLYTEMITTEAILHGDRDYLLSYHPKEHPLALQLGGSDPAALAACSTIAQEFGYDEINLNAGCPSDRVQSGRFGACLMKEPNLVAECLSAMQERVVMPVTLKTRLGVDELDSYADLTKFIDTVATSSRCDTFILHARKAWLQGLSPKENRTIPPLRYDFVYQLKQDFPQLTFILNGGINTLDQMQEAVQQLDGVMIGRHACQHPYFLADIDRIFYGEIEEPLSREAIIAQLLPYVQSQLDKDVRLQQISRHMLGVFHGVQHARQWRRYLSEHAYQVGAGVEVIEGALGAIFSSN